MNNNLLSSFEIESMYFVSSVSKVGFSVVNKGSNNVSVVISKKLHKFNKVGILPIFLPFSIFLSKSVEILTFSDTKSCVNFFLF